MKLLESDGWRLRNQEGSHRQFVHPIKPGKVTVAGHPSMDMPKGTLKSTLRQAGLEES
jgi:predicted RNA binding protein YcfA (HicA-like mRNA interferase family)